MSCSAEPHNSILLAIPSPSVLLQLTGHAWARYIASQQSIAARCSSSRDAPVAVMNEGMFAGINQALESLNGAELSHVELVVRLAPFFAAALRAYQERAALCAQTFAHTVRLEAAVQSWYASALLLDHFASSLAHACMRAAGRQYANIECAAYSQKDFAAFTSIPFPPKGKQSKQLTALYDIQRHLLVAPAVQTLRQCVPFVKVPARAVFAEGIAQQTQDAMMMIVTC